MLFRKKIPGVGGSGYYGFGRREKRKVKSEIRRKSWLGWEMNMTIGKSKGWAVMRLVTGRGAHCVRDITILPSCYNLKTSFFSSEFGKSIHSRCDKNYAILQYQRPTLLFYHTILQHRIYQMFYHTILYIKIIFPTH